MRLLKTSRKPAWVTTGGRFCRFRLLLSDPEAVAQGHTCIVQEASLALTVPEVHRQHAQRRNHNPLSLFLPHRPSTPALANRPLAHAALQANDVPDA
jgi:hypothetical protein